MFELEKRDFQGLAKYNKSFVKYGISLQFRPKLTLTLNPMT